MDKQTLIGAIIGAYEMPDGRKFWLDKAVAREIATRICDMQRVIKPDLSEPENDLPERTAKVASRA